MVRAAPRGGPGPRTPVTLDGERFADLDGFYDEVNRLLAPGARMGRNLDALIDTLRGGVGGPEGEIDFAWTSSAKSRSDLGYPATIAWLEARLLHAHPAFRRGVEEELARARRGEGRTLFDLLLEILRDEPRLRVRLE